MRRAWRGELRRPDRADRARDHAERNAGRPGGRVRGGRIALTGLASHNELRVVADCAYGTGGFGLQRWVDSADGRVYTFTEFEAAHARRVFANFEQPDLKATFTFRVTARITGRCCRISRHPSRGPLARVTAQAVLVQGYFGGAAVWSFPATPRISTYLTAIAAGEYHVVRDSHTTPAAR